MSAAAPGRLDEFVGSEAEKMFRISRRAVKDISNIGSSSCEDVKGAWYLYVVKSAFSRKTKASIVLPSSVLMRMPSGEMRTWAFLAKDIHLRSSWSCREDEETAERSGTEVVAMLRLD